MSMFQRRHYEAIADTLFEMRYLPSTGVDWDTVDTLSRMFGADNPNFNKDKFLERVTDGPR